MKRILIPLAAVLAVAAGAGAAVLATESTQTISIPVPYSIAGQTGEVTVSTAVDIPTVTQTQTVTVTSPPPTTTTPPPTTTSPPPPTSISSTDCTNRASVAGAVIANVSVSGGCSIRATNVTIQDSTLTGSVSISSAGSGAKLLRNKALGFDLKGADDVLIDGNTFDGKGVRDNNELWDSSNGAIPDRWVISNNTFKNFYVNDGSTHSEALFIGYSTAGLIQGNTFTNNGNTGHIFFSWWGTIANPSVSYPRNICVRGNTFNATWDAYYDVNFRDEIPTSANIKIQLDASTGWPQFYGVC